MRSSVLLAALMIVSGAVAAAPARAATSFPACQHFYTGPIPIRPVTGGQDPGTLVPPVDVSNRLPAPDGVSGGVSGSTVTFTFNRVAGAVAYRAFRNGQALQWISDWGQPTLTVTDNSPCQDANYQIYAMSDASGSEPSIGQISTSYRVGADDQLAPWALPKGTVLNYKVTSYNDTGQTALGYNAGPGFCAVDARNIPWGTRFTVPGYGSCYAADIGSWIKDDIVDVWLPGSEANDWGVQQLNLVVD